MKQIPSIISNTYALFSGGGALGEDYSLAATLIGNYVMDSWTVFAGWSGLGR